ncbi:MAG: LigB family dioxygenase [Bacteroidetes bacterium]|nr:LigB family dioxygenase [Bacteroidota bacterium]
MKLNSLNSIFDKSAPTERMPLLFVGHGNPMNAIEDNAFSREMKAIGKTLPKPKAILMVSAHWETKGTFVTAQDLPPTIHDFGGFPKELFATQYPAPGSKWLREEAKKSVTLTNVELNEDWGFDHGCWSVTKNIFPEANIPVIQLSLDYGKDAQYHYDLAKQLSSLREKGVLVIGSGNMVHNFGYVQIKNNDFNAPFGHDWALEANEKFKKYILTDDHKSLIDYKKQGREINLAVPTPEHYLPLLYTLALKEKNENITFFNDVALAGSFSMTSVMIK